jgi:hypothetical protein
MNEIQILETRMWAKYPFYKKIEQKNHEFFLGNMLTTTSGVLSRERDIYIYQERLIIELISGRHNIRR